MSKTSKGSQESIKKTSLFTFRIQGRKYIIEATDCIEAEAILQEQLKLKK